MTRPITITCPLCGDTMQWIDGDTVYRCPDCFASVGPQLGSAIDTLQQRLAAMEEALTPSGGTKAAYIGEFMQREECEGELDRCCDQTIQWTTIKDIMKAIRARAEQPKGGAE